MADAALTAELKELALALGFTRAGVAQAAALEPEGDRLRAYIAEGRHGEMGYMADTAEVRIDPGHENMLSGALSVLVVVAPYGSGREVVGPAPGTIARYAHGRDYHTVLNRRARKLEKHLRGLGHQARASVDTRPVFERAFAQRAGVGFIGKNCCLIVPGLGSHLFLSCVVTTASLVPDAPMKERCGSCTLCLDACPTEAFEAPRTLDARRCISYLSIEKRGPIEPALRAPMGGWIYGCDACQDVCPYNRTSPPAAEVTAPFAPHARWESLDAEDFLSMSDESFEQVTEGSPMKRARAEGMARNAAIVLGNEGDARHLPALRRAAEGDPRPVVRDAAAWALARLAERGVA